ncbi:hypothetical protein RGB72_10510 [Glutamicibacter protophormiae]|nr:hypothetical protein RGB72_10510 [Glutamicibacter protophormiae]
MRVTLAPIAKDCGIHEMTLSMRTRKTDIDDGHEPGTSRAESHERRDARRRIRLLEQENEALRRVAAYLSQTSLPSRGSA